MNHLNSTIILEIILGFWDKNYKNELSTCSTLVK